jgi:superoxide dismutase, Cu-Zn family
MEIEVRWEHDGRGTMSGRLKIAAAVSAVALVAGIVIIPGTSLGSSNPQWVRATVKDTSGTVLGTVRFSRHGDGVKVKANLTGLTPGFHGFHVHAVGVCDPETGFTSAGGHYDPEGTGLHGQHAGDMPSLLAADDGSADLGFTSDRLTIESLRDADGSAVIVHAGADNFANTPDRYHSHTEDVFGPDSPTRATGDAGARPGCGVLAGPQN